MAQKSENVRHIQREVHRTMSLAGASASSISNIKREMPGVPKLESFGIAKL